MHSSGMHYLWASTPFNHSKKNNSLVWWIKKIAVSQTKYNCAFYHKHQPYTSENECEIFSPVKSMLQSTEFVSYSVFADVHTSRICFYVTLQHTTKTILLNGSFRVVRFSSSRRCHSLLSSATVPIGMLHEVQIHLFDRQIETLGILLLASIRRNTFINRMTVLWLFLNRPYIYIYICIYWEHWALIAINCIGINCIKCRTLLLLCIHRAAFRHEIFYSKMKMEWYRYFMCVRCAI